jgi:hypothetical protein
MSQTPVQSPENDPFPSLKTMLRKRLFDGQIVNVLLKISLTAIISKENSLN